MDRDGNGQLDINELEAALDKMGEQSRAVIITYYCCCRYSYAAPAVSVAAASAATSLNY